MNGSGRPGSEALTEALGDHIVHEVLTTQASKELTFARLGDLLSSGQFVLPDDPVLLRELSSLEATPTKLGGLTIAAPTGQHDDRSLSLSFTMLGIDQAVNTGRASSPRDAPPDDEWTRTPSGVHIPRRPRPRWGGFQDTRAYLRAW